MLGLFIIVLSTIDILLEGVGPRNVINLWDIISIELKCTKELVET